MPCPACPASQVMKEDDANWPAPDRVGRQELEVVMGNEHISFATTKLGSLLQVRRTPAGRGRRCLGRHRPLRRALWVAGAHSSRAGWDPGLAAPDVWVLALPAGAKQQGPRGAARLLLPGAGKQGSRGVCRGPEVTSSRAPAALGGRGSDAPGPQVTFPPYPTGLVNPPERCPALQDLKCFVFSLVSSHFKIQVGACRRGWGWSTRVDRLSWPALCLCIVLAYQ